MKNCRLLNASSITALLFLLLLTCMADMLIGRSDAAELGMKVVDKNSPASEMKPPEAEPAGIKPPEMKPQSASPLADAKRHAIGCVFPLTGRFADAGNKALDAILLSSELFTERAPSPWKIVVSDSGGEPQGIKKAVAYLADEAKVIMIIAIAGTTEAAEAAGEAQKRKIPLLLIASKESITDTGDYVFQHFLTPSQQVEALSKYAGDTLNLAIYSVLYPQDDYGQEMVRLFRNEIQKRGGKVNQAIPYGKAQTDFTEQIKKLTGQKSGSPGKNFTAAPEPGKLLVDFEALFIPDSYLRVKMIASQLAFYDVRGIQLLGSSLWNSSDLLKKGPEDLEGAVFADSFLADGILPETNDFVDIYYSTYAREPGNIEALAYDSMELVLSILQKQQIETRDEFRESLLAVRGFRGVTGSISFGGHRVAQKEAFILRVLNGKIEQVK